MIIHYTGYSREQGGIHGVLATLSGHLDRRRVAGVGLLYPGDRLGRLRVLRLPAGLPDRMGIASLASALRLALRLRSRELLRGRRPVSIHGHSREGLLLALCFRLIGGEAAATVHVFGRERWFYRWAFQFLGGRLARLGPAMKRYYDLGDRTWTGCLPDCLPAWLTAAVEEVGAFRRPQASPDFVVACVGALVPVKEWELALQALAYLPVGFRVSHAGGEGVGESASVYACELRDAVRASPHRERWRWCGQVADAPTWMKGADCLLVCGRREAFSLAALEAASVGLPLVAPESSGTKDLVEALGVGFLYREGDARALAKALMAVAASRGQGQGRGGCPPSQFHPSFSASGYATFRERPAVI